MSFPNCIEYYTSTPIGIIISFHGGCFSGGKISYNIEQNNLLCDMGFIVYQPEFPKKYSEFKRWCNEYIPPFNKRSLPIYVLGRSSGGYLAKYVYSNYKFIHGGIYICPILFPSERYNCYPQFKNKTISFFDDEEEDMSICTDSEHIILGKNDKNIPYYLFSNIMGGNIYVDDSSKSHLEILNQSGSEFRHLVNQICDKL
jgi:hypothetical protein